MITFIIPNYDKPDLTINCVRSLFEKVKSPSCIVVDDGSPSQKVLGERLANEFPSVTYIPLPQNGGFSVACNAGMKAAKGHVVLLNNDCVLTCDAEAVIRKVFSENQNIGIVGALLHYPNGQIQHDGMDYLPRVGGAFVHGHANTPRNSRYCTSVTGALFAIRKEVIEKIGMLDEAFYAACEDSDYCLRAWKAGFYVWYERELTATHSEGATRGRTQAEKQKRLGPQRYARELATIKAFRVKHSDQSMNEINAKAGALNKSHGLTPLPELKIELGCGSNPQPGYVACDARRVKGVQHVFDFGYAKFPFGNGTVGEILMNHSIEHVSYRRLPHVLNECARVLPSGGKLIIRTPDLRFIVEKYMANEITPEWPDDEQFIADNFGGNPRNLSPCWWTNIKLFAGQDYPGNEHRFCFDFETLKSVLEKFGFERVKRFTDKPVFSPGEIYCEVFKV